MNAAMPLPLDVKLMNLTTSLLVGGLALAAVLAGLWWAARNPAFAIARITVGGDTAHNSAATLRASVMPRLSGNFFTLDLSGAQSAFQSAPWVRKAVVRREFPDQLQVTLQEHVPVAHWGEGDAHLVNSYGEVFDPAGREPEGVDLPRLTGPEGQSTLVLDMYRQLAPLVAPLDAKVAALALQSRGNWRVDLDRGAQIELGTGDATELAARLRQFVATAKDVAARHQRTVDSIEAADLRHVGGYALRLRGVSTVRVESGGQPPARR